MFKWLSISQCVNYSLGVIALPAVLFLFAPANPFIQAGGSLFLFLMFAIYLKYQVCQPVSTLLTQMKRVVSGGKPDNCHLNRVDEIGMLMCLINQSGLNLSSLVDNINTQISGTRTISQRVSKEGTVLHEHSKETSADLQQTVAAIEEAGSAVQQTVETAAHTTTMADETSASATEGGDIMERTIITMQATSRDNGQIVDIIGVINSIAFQTNILALNAAAEAMRAGESGRGSVVVAAEIRNLAQHSVSTAKGIKQLIEKNVANVSSGVKIVERTEAHLTGTIGDVLQMSMTIKDISLATREQTQALDLINDSISRVGTMTHNNAEMAEHVTDATADPTQRSSRLRQTVQVSSAST